VRNSCAAFIDSYGGLPFVDFHSVSTAVMDSLFFSLRSRSLEKKDGDWCSKTYTFDPKPRYLITEETWQKDLELPPHTQPKYDTLKLDFDKFQDGTSLFYYARANIHKEKSVRVPTVVLGKPGYTLFYFSPSKSTEKSDAIPNPVATILLEGKAEFEGVYGLTGDFKGWFTDDDAAIPIRAKLKVILGSVNVELKEWRRPGWAPPRAD
jgi:hypothetical protein